MALLTGRSAARETLEVRTTTTGFGLAVTVIEVVPPLLPYESRWTCGRRQDSAIRPRTSRRRVPGSALTVPDGSTRCHLSLIHISEPTRLGMISYAVFCL